MTKSTGLKTGDVLVISEEYEAVVLKVSKSGNTRYVILKDTSTNDTIRLPIRELYMLTGCTGER